MADNGLPGEKIPHVSTEEISIVKNIFRGCDGLCN